MKTPTDHRFIQSVAKKHGIWYSRPGNGICHQVHLERFGKPGKTLIGSDSHTPTGGGIGMLAMGAGGLDVAVAMGGGAYHITMPKMLRVNLLGKLPAWVSAKDIILKVLQILSVKGGVGKIVEYAGPGVETLTVPERATITNMGAELGATTSIFPSDDVTRAFLKAQGREADWVPLSSDPDAVYDEEITIDLSELEPLAACPHSPDNVKPVSELAGKKIDQVCIGSCTNSSYLDLMRVASILKGKVIADNVSLAIAPGSRQVYNMIAQNGALSDIVSAGARVLECACGPCIGMGQAPNSAGISLRTFNRNFEGRSGTADGQIYLVSPETAAASALTGVFTDPRTLGEEAPIAMPVSFTVNDNMILPPASPEEAKDVRDPARAEHQAVPDDRAAAGRRGGQGAFEGGRQHHDRPHHAGRREDPAVPQQHPVPFELLLHRVRQGLPGAREGIRQGHHRRRAELRPGLVARTRGARALYLGIKAVLAKSFARIHCANLANAGIVPLTFEDATDYDRIDQMDDLALPHLREELSTLSDVTVENKTKGITFKAHAQLTERQRDMVLAGGLLNYTKANS